MNSKINCLIIDDEPIAREIIESYLQKTENFNLLASCKNAMEAFKIINSQKVDLLFLDINMPEISGLSFAKSLNPEIKIIFTTAYREYALDGFDLKAVDYLLKPISFGRFLQSVNKYVAENVRLEKPNINLSYETDKQDYIFVRADRKMVKIEFSEIEFIESLSDYIKIHLAGKTVITRETISNIEAKLPKKDFIRTHRSFIVSFKKINSFTNEFVEIANKEIPISRSFKAEVLKKIERIGRLKI